MMKNVEVVLVGSLMCSIALAGPEWPEVGDAGSLPGSAQTVSGGGGSLTAITGRLEGPPGLPGSGVGDFQDMYLIDIKDPLAFRASTDVEFGGFADFNPQLWLFFTDGRGLLANLDAAQGLDGSSTLVGQSNDGSGAFIPNPGHYLLAITGIGSEALGGPVLLPMFEFQDPNEVSGADGPGGGPNAISGWTAPGAFGNYKISLVGASTIVPAPGGVLVFSGIGLFVRRRRV